MLSWYLHIFQKLTLKSHQALLIWTLQKLVWQDGQWLAGAQALDRGCLVYPHTNKHRFFSLFLMLEHIFLLFFAVVFFFLDLAERFWIRQQYYGKGFSFVFSNQKLGQRVSRNPLRITNRSSIFSECLQATRKANLIHLKLLAFIMCLHKGWNFF